MVSGTTCEFPLTQSNLADALGLSTVHVNRILRQLREERLATVANRKLTINNIEALEELCDFDESYINKMTLLCDPFAAKNLQAACRFAQT